MTRHTPNWLQAGSYSAALDRDLIGALWPAPALVGMAVTPQSGMTVQVASGRCAVPTQNNTGSTLCTSDAVENVTLAAAPGSGTNRYDLIIVQPRGNDLDGGANNDWIMTQVTGTAAASPAVPATPAGSVCIAVVYVPGGSASVTAGNITAPALLPGPIAAHPTSVCRAHISPQIGQGNGVATIPWNVTDEDTDGGLAAGIYTVKRAGLWLQTGWISYDPAVSTGVRAMGATNPQNLGGMFGGFFPPNTDPSASGRCSVVLVGRCKAGDTMSFQSYQNSGGGCYATSGQAAFTWLGP
jgi:hypothetical protein